MTEPLLPPIRRPEPRCDGEMCLALATVEHWNGERYCPRCVPPYDPIITDEVWEAGKSARIGATHPDSTWVSRWNSEQRGES